MFGSGFGSRTTSAFGQTSTFGKPATSFASPGFGTTNTSLFGQSSQPTTSLFGNTAPTFGQTTTTQSFGAFGSTGPSLFGAQQNAASTSGGLFGSPNTNASTAGGSLFGVSTAPSGFGTNSSFTSFGSPSNTGLFGQQPQTATLSTSLFGQTAPSGTGLFGTSTSSTPTGTTIKFNPVTGQDSLVKSGVQQSINVKHQCITCMKEYEGKSLEELRYEDYLANRKGPSQGAQTGTGLFGGSGQTQLFGSTSNTTNTTGGNLFGSSGFGQSGVFGQTGLQANNSLFGKPASTTPFGTTTTTQSTAFGSFGQNTSLFGANANQAKPSAFGASQPGTTLFGSNTAGNTNFASQPSGFSFGTQQQNQGIGLFGQQNKFSGFGAQTTSNFTFGSNTNAANTTSLFGSKPAATGFGITPTTSTSAFGSSPFGANTATAGGSGTLFSGGFNKPQTSGFAFGQNSTAPGGTLGGSTLNSGSLFGNSAAKPSGGLFSNTGGSSGTLFNTGGFGTTGGFGSGTNTNFGGLNFGSSMFNSGTASTLQNVSTGNVCDQIQVLSVIPYGNSPLYKHLRTTSGKTDELLKPAVMPQKLNVDSNNYKVSTQINNIVTRKAHSFMEPSKKSLFEIIEEEVATKLQNQQRQSPRYLKLKPKSVLNKTKIISTNGDANSSNVGATDTVNPNESKETIDSYAHSTSVGETEHRNAQSGSPTVAESNKHESTFTDNTMLELGTQKSPISRKVVSFISDTSSSHILDASSSSANESLDEDKDSDTVETSIKNHACNIKLTRPDYFTVPSLNDLDEMVYDEGRCIVKNFTVGRHKYGNVTFYDAFDVAGLDLDSIVFFHHKEVEIYPNDDTKPPVGTGLNRRAQVTLDRVWPIDKTTREIIQSPDRLKQLNFIGRLKRASAKMNAQFIEYRPLTGSWVFEVEHFSKYGLDDSDEDETPKANEKLSKNVTSKPISEIVDLKNMFPNRRNYSKKRGLDGKPMFADREITDRFDLDENDEIMALDEEQHFLSLKNASTESDYLNEEFPSPVEKIAKSQDTSLHKVQLMKASFYVHDDISDPEISLENGIPDLDLFATGNVDAYRSLITPSKNVLPLIKSQFTSHFPPPIDIPVADFAEKEYKPPYLSPEVKSLSVTSKILLRPQRVAVKYRNGVFPMDKSIVKLIKTPLCDVGLYFGRHFRIGWSKGLSLTCLSSTFCTEMVMGNQVEQLCRLFVGRKGNDFSPNVVNKLQLTTRLSEASLKNMEVHLELCLQGSTVNREEGFPILIPNSGSYTLHEHCELEQQTVRVEENYDRQVWELMVALWGNVPGINEEHELRNNHKSKMLRKAALSEWLKTVVSVIDEQELNEPNHIDGILSFLSRGEVHEACELAIKNDDFNLALLMSQIGGNEVTRSLMKQQLNQWHESEADQLIDVGRLKIMTLIAGHMLYISSKGIINTCENLDWKRAFALHLWYITRPSDSLVEALLQYESAFQMEEKFAASPQPKYINNSLEFETHDGRAPEDLCYHLMKLYSRRSYPLEKVLNPITHTSDILDYRLSWFVMITLRSLGYDHLSKETEYIIHTSFAAQLEISSLWHWAVFVLLHIRDESSRMNCVKSIIDKNVQLFPDGSIGLTDKEKFVNEKLQVPAEWLFYSKAVLAFSLNKFEEAAWYYIHSKRWNEAHEIIINQLLTKAIINDKYDVVRSLINEIVASDCILSGWNYKGAIIFDYLNMIDSVNSMISCPPDDTSFLESLQPLLSSLCTKIKFFPTTTVKERLCQAEISKRIIQLIRIILNIQFGKRGMSIRFIVSLVDQLPLPEDYKQQELQDIISWWIDK